MWTLLALAAFATAMGRPLPAQDIDAVAAARVLEQTFVDSIAAAERCVVAIARLDGEAATPPLRILDPFAIPGEVGRNDPQSREFVPDHFGSGVIVADPKHPNDRYVLTTCHVAYGERGPRQDDGFPADGLRIYVRLAGGEVVTASAHPRAADMRSDLAVLRLDLEAAEIKPEEVVPIEFGSAEGIRKGRFVVVLGNPYAQARDGSASASIGIISNTARRPLPPDDPRGVAGDDALIHHYGTLLQIDARLNLGTSGGAVIDLDGHLIGLTTSLAAIQGYESSVGYAIPFDDQILPLIEDLINGYEVEYGFLGIQPRTVARGDVLLRGTDIGQPSAALVMKVAVDSPASVAGLRGDDVVLAINDRRVDDEVDLMRIIGLLGPDAEAILTVWRRSSEETLRMTARLGKWPVYDGSRIVSTVPRFPAWRGLQVDYPTARKQFMPSDPLSVYRRAVVVTSVADESPAAAAGFKVGDFIESVDGTHVERPAEFHAAVADQSGRIALTLLKGGRRFVNP